MNCAALAELADFASRMGCVSELISEADIAIQKNETERAREIVVLMMRQIATSYGVSRAIEKALEGKNG